MEKPILIFLVCPLRLKDVLLPFGDALGMKFFNPYNETFSLRSQNNYYEPFRPPICRSIFAEVLNSLRYLISYLNRTDYKLNTCISTGAVDSGGDLFDVKSYYPFFKKV